MRDAASSELRPGRRKPLFATVALLLLMVTAAHWLSRSHLTEPEVPSTPVRANVEAPPMCPWRQPENDRRAFFPAANRHETKAVILSDQLAFLKQRLGRWPTPDENPLYLYPIYQGPRRVGTVVARRVKGEYGAIEIVLGVDTNGRVVGLQLQRLREPEAVARELQSSRWLQRFKGLSLADAESLQQVVKPLPAVAEQSGQAIAEGMRSVLILLQAAERQSVSGNAPHH